MKFIVSFLMIALLSFTACLFFPWWSIAIASFLVSVIIPLRPGRAFLCGFLSLFILWGALSFWLSNNNGHLLAHKMSVIILKTGNSYMLILATALIGAVIGGLAALTASLIRYTPEVPVKKAELL